jgi:sugar diacid utilization regulator
MANARLHRRERATAERLRAANVALADTVDALQRSTDIHQCLTRVAVRQEGQEGIARAVHELTGFPVAVEDGHGNLRAWAGDHRPEPYPKESHADRARLLDRAMEAGTPIRDGARLVAVASPGTDVVGVLALVDPEGRAGDQERVALEHGATVLAVELSRLQNLAETERRLGRDLIDQLLAGTDQDSALARAQGLGYDLERPHRVVVVEPDAHTAQADPAEDALFHAVRRAGRDTGAGSLLVARPGSVVLLADADVPWDRLRAAVSSELGGRQCRLGVGGPADRPEDFPRSYQQAALALKVQRATGSAVRATVFTDLGVYGLLADGDVSETERFIEVWLGSLLAYDKKKGSNLVATLGHYLECGKSYDATATALAVHRSTLKYRLQRIAELSGHDLSNPDTTFNLQFATRAWQTLEALGA